MRAFERAGYVVDWKELSACDFGAPTSRKRLFLVARRDGEPIQWPTPTHGAAGTGLLPYRTASECIDWALPTPSIFGRKKGLAAGTLERVAKGVQRYVLEAEPFLAPAHVNRSGFSSQPGEVAAFLAKHYGGVVGQPLTRPLGTITGTDHHSLVAVFLVKMYGTSHSAPVTKPLPTITATGNHLGEVRALLERFVGTQATDGPAVTIRGERYLISDIALRMLQPHELFAGQGFDSGYVIDAPFEGKPLSKEAQTKLCGNSVSPPVAAALVSANYENRPAAVRVAA